MTTRIAGDIPYFYIPSTTSYKTAENLAAYIFVETFPAAAAVPLGSGKFDSFPENRKTFSNQVSRDKGLFDQMYSRNCGNLRETFLVD